MTAIQIFYPEGNSLPQIPSKLFNKFPNIVSDPSVHAGWPHIKGTRILATDIFKAQIQGYTLETMLMEFKQMGVSVSKNELLEACRFTIDWLYHLNEETSKKTSK